jgi:hypothetical protein
LSAQTNTEEQYKGGITAEQKRDESYKPIVAYTTAGLLIGATVLYGTEVWDWGEQKKFRFGREGFFGKNTDSGGADKLGHAYAHYCVQRGVYNVFEWANFSKTGCLLWSVGASFTVGLLIEIGDGSTGKYGFSWEDLTANTLGIALGAVLESFPKVDEFVHMSYSILPTKGFRRGPTGRQALHLTSDYSGHKGMLNFKFAGFKSVGYNIPEFMRYIMLDFGYYTRGYTLHDRRDDITPKRTRHPYLGVSLNFMEVVKDFFAEDKRSSLRCRGLQQPFKYYHIPVGYELDYTLR